MNTHWSLIHLSSGAASPRCFSYPPSSSKLPENCKSSCPFITEEMRTPMHCSTGTVRTAIGPRAQPSKIPSFGQRGENIAKTDPPAPVQDKKKERKIAGSYIPAKATPTSQREAQLFDFFRYRNDPDSALLSFYHLEVEMVCQKYEKSS